MCKVARSSHISAVPPCFQNYINAHANALLEFEIKAGDTIAVWLPESAEKVCNQLSVFFLPFHSADLINKRTFMHIQHVTLMAAAKAGLKVVDVDIKLTEISEIRAFLTAANCKVIYFKPEHEDHDYLLLLRKAIPEFFECETSFSGSHMQCMHTQQCILIFYCVDDLYVEQTTTATARCSTPSISARSSTLCTQASTSKTVRSVSFFTPYILKLFAT